MRMLGWLAVSVVVLSAAVPLRRALAQGADAGAGARDGGRGRGAG